MNLGDVQVIAEVKLTGHDLGLLWKPPFRVDVTKIARPGPNDLEVRVTNLWPNRLIGDAALPPEKRFTRTHVTKFTKDAPLMPSGRWGRVTLRSADSPPSTK